MTKLLTNNQFNNPLFNPAFGEYLTAAGYAVTLTSSSIFFGNATKRVFIKGDSVDLYDYVPEEPGQENEKWVFRSHYTGIMHLNIYTWMQLMQVMGVVNVYDFLKSAKTQGLQCYAEAASLVNEFSKLQLLQ